MLFVLIKFQILKYCAINSANFVHIIMGKFKLSAQTNVVQIHTIILLLSILKICFLNENWSVYLYWNIKRAICYDEINNIIITGRKKR